MKNTKAMAGWVWVLIILLIIIAAVLIYILLTKDSSGGNQIISNLGEKGGSSLQPPALPD